LGINGLDAICCSDQCYLWLETERIHQKEEHSVHKLVLLSICSFTSVSILGSYQRQADGLSGPSIWPITTILVFILDQVSLDLRVPKISEVATINLCFLL